MPSLFGDQLAFAFPGEVEPPWEGASPRSLTKGAQLLFLRREPQKDDCDFLDPDQMDLVREAERGPPRYGGAPSLLPLPKMGG